MTTKVLVTGGLGTVGVLVLQQLLDNGDEAIALDIREDYSFRPSLEGNVPFYKADLLDTEHLTEILKKERVDSVCHLAARVTGTAEINGDPDPYQTFLVNCMGPVSVYEAAQRAGVARVAFCSGKAVYGPIEDEFDAPTYRPVSEDHPRVGHPTSRQYDNSKILGEEAGRYYADRYGFSFRAIRPANIIRLGKQGGGSGGAERFPAMVRAALEGENYQLTDIQGMKDDLIYGKDIAHGLILASTVEHVSNWAFNIGTGVASTLSDYAEAVRKVIPAADIDINTVPDNRTYRVQCVLDIGRARTELGYEPRFSLEGAVRDLVAELS